jgi:predicted Fe-Mo cluster-binding NifX family protein
MLSLREGQEVIHMRIAIPFYMGNIFQHFGHAPQFKVYEVENHQVLMEMLVEVEEQGHGAVADLLQSLDVRVVICGNIGEGAMKALQNAGIIFYGGVTGDADEAITALVQGGLKYDPNIRCTAHADGHGCDGDCGECGDCGGDCSACGH